MKERTRQGSGKRARLTRRSVLKGAAAAAAVTSLLGPSEVMAARKHSGRGKNTLTAGDLVAPLREGTALGKWKVVRLGGVEAGACCVVMEDEHGSLFQVDICRRDGDAAAPMPPARTDQCDLFVSNGGDGSVQTRESHGLAAMALAEIVRTNEHRLDLSSLTTLRQRLVSHRQKVVRHV